MATSIPSTPAKPLELEPEVMRQSVDRILACQPEALYLTHFCRVGDVQRLGSDLHRLIEAHLAVAERERDSGPDREAWILAGLWALMEAEARAAKAGGWPPNSGARC